MKPQLCLLLVLAAGLSLCLAVDLADTISSDHFENFVRRNVPTGFTMSAFVEVCEGCGALYGRDYTYKCLSDVTRATFKGCLIAVTRK